MKLVGILVIGVICAGASSAYSETTVGYGETEIFTEIPEESTTGGFTEYVEIFSEEEATTVRLPTITNAPPKKITTTTQAPVYAPENFGDSVRRPPAPGSDCGKLFLKKKI